MHASNLDSEGIVALPERIETSDITVSPTIVVGGTNVGTEVAVVVLPQTNVGVQVAAASPGAVQNLVQYNVDVTGIGQNIHF